LKIERTAISDDPKSAHHQSETMTDATPRAASSGGPCLPLIKKFISYVASYVGPIQTGFLRGFQKSSSGTGIVIPLKKVPQKRKTQESRGFLQELPT